MAEKLITDLHTNVPEPKPEPETQLQLWDVIYLPSMRFVACNLTLDEVKAKYANTRLFLACPS